MQCPIELDRTLEQAVQQFTHGPRMADLADCMPTEQQSENNRRPKNKRDGDRSEVHTETAGKRYRKGKKALFACLHACLDNTGCEDQWAWNLLRHTHADDALRELAHWSGARILEERRSVGYDARQQNAAYTLKNHYCMVNDRTRVDAYAACIRRHSAGLNVLDVGTGPFCLLSRLALGAGAKSVTAIEHAENAISSAIDFFRDEWRFTNRELLADYEGLRHTAGAQWGRTDTGAQLALCSIKIGAAQQEEEADTARFRSQKEREYRRSKDTARTDQTVHANTMRAFIELKADDCADWRSLQLWQGMSFEVSPVLAKELASADRRQFTMVVHEILGHIASAEGAVKAIQDLHAQGLLAPDCVFVPAVARTMLAPTEVLSNEPVASVMHRMFNMFVTNSNCGKPRRNVRHHCVRFPTSSYLARPQPFEHLDFAKLGSEPLTRKTVLHFTAERDAVLDGVHLYMDLHLDNESSFNTADTQTSWVTIYIKLSEDGALVYEGDKIMIECDIDYDRESPAYKVKMMVGGREGHESREHRTVGEFKWDGCG